MPQFSFNSRYYAEDKDIFDLLKASSVTLKQIARFARKRGVFVSEQDSKEDILSYFSSLPNSWPQLQELMAEISSDDREEKVSMVRVQSVEPIVKIKEAAEFVQNLRAQPRNEAYSITETANGNFQVKVKYTDFDPKTTRLMQRRRREVKIEVEKLGDRFEIRHDHTARSVEIVNRMVEVLTSTSETEPKVEAVDLSGVTDPGLRTKFFTQLITNVQGFRLIDVKDLKVDRYIPIVPEDEDTTEKPSEKPAAKKNTDAELKSMVRRMVLSGDGVLTSDEYKALRKNEFYISKVTWMSRETDGDGRDVLFNAEFSGETDGKSFVYDIRWVWERDEDGNVRQVKTALAHSDRAIFLRRLEDAAYKSLKEIQNQIEKDQPAANEKEVPSSPDQEVQNATTH